jgi:hypothetical protein
MNRNCYTCRVRKENCGEVKKISLDDWTRHVCVMWFPMEKPRDICGIGDCDTCPDTDCKQHPCNTDDPAYWEK